MKRAEKHISTFLISIAIFLVFGNLAFANVTFEKNIATEISALQDDERGKPFVFDEVSISKVSPTVSQNEYLGPEFVGILYSSKDFRFDQVPSLFTCSYSLKDKRELIFQYLFPFHFFW